jgi:hypothetical protein
VRSRSFRDRWRACDGQSFNQTHSGSDFQTRVPGTTSRRRDVDARRPYVLAGVSEPCCIRIDSFPRFDKTARAAQLSRGFEFVLLHAPKISSPLGSTSAKSMLFVGFLSADSHESKVREWSEVAYNPHPRRRSSVVEQPPCKRQVVCSIQTGGTSFTPSCLIRVFGGSPPAVGGLLAVMRGGRCSPRARWYAGIP